MKFDLVTPCKTCPFRTDRTFPLTVARVREILSALFDRDQTFSCHGTVDYAAIEERGEDMHDEGYRHIPGAEEQHCAGAMVLLEKSGRANQMMRIAERLGFYDHKRLKMDAPVFASRDAMVKAFQKLNRRKAKT